MPHIHIFIYYICLLYEEILHNDHIIYYGPQLYTLILYSACARVHIHTEYVNTLSLNKEELLANSFLGLLFAPLE